VHTTTEDSNNSALLADSRRVTLNDLNASTNIPRITVNSKSVSYILDN